MVDYVAQSLKRSRNLPKPAVSSPRGSPPPSKVNYDMLPSTITQVNTPVPCMVGLKGGLGCSSADLASSAKGSTSPSPSSSYSSLSLPASLSLLASLSKVVVFKEVGKEGSIVGPLMEGVADGVSKGLGTGAREGASPLMGSSVVKGLDASGMGFTLPSPAMSRSHKGSVSRGNGSVSGAGKGK